MNPFRLRSKWTEKPPGGGEGGGGGEYGDWREYGDVIRGPFEQHGWPYPENYQGVLAPPGWTGGPFAVPENPDINNGPTGRLVPPPGWSPPADWAPKSVPDLPESPLASNVMDFPNSPDFSDYWLNRVTSSLPENIDASDINSVDEMNALRAPGSEALNVSDYQDLIGKGYEPNIKTLDPNNLAANEPTGADAAVYDMPGAGPLDDAVPMPPEPMPWDQNLGQKYPEGWDPLAKYLHDETAPSALPRFPEATGALGGALPLLYAALGPLGVDPELTWELDQARRMARGTAGAETPTDLAPDTNSQQLGTADSGTDTNGLQFFDQPNQDAINPVMPLPDDPMDFLNPILRDPGNVQSPSAPDAIDGLVDPTQWGIQSQPPGNSGEVPYTDPTQPPADQNQYFTDPLSGDSGGGYTGGYDPSFQGGSPSPVYSGAPDQGYNVGFVPKSGVNTGVNGEGGGSGGGYDTGGFGGGGSVGGGDMGDGSDTVADWLDWLFGGGGGSPHTGTPDPFGESIY